MIIIIKKIKKRTKQSHTLSLSSPSPTLSPPNQNHPHHRLPSPWKSDRPISNLPKKSTHKRNVFWPNIHCITDKLILCQDCNWDAHGNCIVSVAHDRSPTKPFSGLTSEKKKKPSFFIVQRTIKKNHRIFSFSFFLFIKTIPPPWQEPHKWGGAHKKKVGHSPHLWGSVRGAVSLPSCCS